MFVTTDAGIILSDDENINEVTDVNSQVKMFCSICNEEFTRELGNIHNAHTCYIDDSIIITYIRKWINSKVSKDYVKLTDEWIARQWRIQGGRCYLTGVRLRPDVGHNQNIKLKRINKDIGYVPGNVVFISKSHKFNKKINQIYDHTAHIRLECKILDPDGKVPTRKRLTDAGYDLYSIMDAVVPPHGAANIKTGIALSAPDGYYYTIDGRSGMAMKGVVPFRGIIDAGYCGEVMVALLNFSDDEYIINKSDRIAQVIVHRMIPHDVVMVENFSSAYNARGTLGFGSSGK